MKILLQSSFMAKLKTLFLSAILFIISNPNAIQCKWTFLASGSLWIKKKTIYKKNRQIWHNFYVIFHKYNSNNVSDNATVIT